MGSPHKLFWAILFWVAASFFGCGNQSPTQSEPNGSEYSAYVVFGETTKVVLVAPPNATERRIRAAQADDVQMFIQKKPEIVTARMETSLTIAVTNVYGLSLVTRPLFLEFSFTDAYDELQVKDAIFRIKQDGVRVCVQEGIIRIDFPQ